MTEPAPETRQQRSAKGWDDDSSDEENAQQSRTARPGNHSSSSGQEGSAKVGPIVDSTGQTIGEGITPEMLDQVIADMPTEERIMLRQMEETIENLMRGQQQPDPGSGGLVRKDGDLNRLQKQREVFIRKRYNNLVAMRTDPSKWRWPANPSTPTPGDDDSGNRATDDEEANVGEEEQILPGPTRTPQGHLVREAHRRRGEDGRPRQQPGPPPAAATYAPTVYVHSAPDVGFFHGKREDDWQKFRTKLVAHFRATGQTDQMAAEQFSRYLEGPAYQFWDTLPRHKKRTLPALIQSFNTRYSDEMRQEYYQQQYDSLQYMGYEKETLDDFAARLITLVAKAYPDFYGQDGKYAPRREMRKIYARRKFWECMTPDMRQAMFIHFQTREASIKDQLAHAKLLQAAKWQNRQEETPYETACYVEAGLPKGMLAELTTVMKTQGREIKELREDIRRREDASRSQRSQPNAQPNKAPEPKTERGQQPQKQRTNSADGKMSNFDLSKVRCHGCGEFGHIRRNCPLPKEDQKPRPRDNRRDDRRDNRGSNRGDRRERSYDRRDRDEQRGEWRRRPDSRRDSYRDDQRNDRRDDRGGRDRRGDDRREQTSYDRSWRGRQSRDYSEEGRRDETRPRRQTEDRRERKTPMNTMPIERVSSRTVAREALNLLARLEDTSSGDEYIEQENC